MASFTKFNVRISDDDHKKIHQYAKDNNHTLQEEYGKIIQSFLDFVQSDFTDYIAQDLKNPNKTISIDSKTYNALVETARHQGRHIGTVANTAITFFLRKRK